MKYLIALLFFISSTLVYAQQDDAGGFVGFKSNSKTHSNSKNPTQVFKVGIIPFFFGQVYGTGELRFNYERVIAPKQSILAGISYVFPNLLGLAVYSAGATGGRGANGGYSGYGSRPGFLDANYAFEGVRGMLGYRYYFLKSKGAPRGLYAGPYLSYNFVNVSVKAAPQDYEGLNYFDACGVFGAQVVSSKHFAFDFTCGLGYKDNFISHPNVNMSLSPQTIPIVPFDHVKFLIQLNFGYGL
jgi:hypothetical protein